MPVQSNMTGVARGQRDTGHRPVTPQRLSKDSSGERIHASARARICACERPGLCESVAKEGRLGEINTDHKEHAVLLAGRDERSQMHRNKTNNRRRKKHGNTLKQEEHFTLHFVSLTRFTIH
jgi:hypothetical protein